MKEFEITLAKLESEYSEGLITDVQYLGAVKTLAEGYLEKIRDNAEHTISVIEDYL